MSTSMLADWVTASPMLQLCTIRPVATHAVYHFLRAPPLAIPMESSHPHLVISMLPLASPSDPELDCQHAHLNLAEHH